MNKVNCIKRGLKIIEIKGVIIDIYFYMMSLLFSLDRNCIETYFQYYFWNLKKDKYTYLHITHLSSYFDQYRRLNTGNPFQTKSIFVHTGLRDSLFMCVCVVIQNNILCTIKCVYMYNNILYTIKRYDIHIYISQFGIF